MVGNIPGLLQHQITESLKISGQSLIGCRAFFTDKYFILQSTRNNKVIFDTEYQRTIEK